MIRRNRRRRRAARLIVALLTLAALAIGWGRYHSWLSDLVSAWLCAKPPGIIVHHSATPPRVNGRAIDAAALDRIHATRGFVTFYRGRVYHIGYHFVILQDGTVQRGRPIGCRGAHTHGRAIYNRRVGICLVGNFSSKDNPNGAQGPVRPTRAQMKALVRLCRSLMREYEIPVDNVRRHRDFNQTECPGDRFPYSRLVAELSSGE